jgi:O-antigen/teichoic acid export membrane protein
MPAQPDGVPKPQPQAKRIAQIALRSTTWSLIGNFGVQLIGLLIGLALAALVSKEAFGLFTLATTWSGWLNFRTKLGLASAATGHSESGPALLGTYLRLELIAGAINILLTIGAAVWIFASGAPQAALVVALMAVLIGIDTLMIPLMPYAIALERELQLSRITLAALAATIIGAVASLSLALAGAEAWSYVAMPVLTLGIGMTSAYALVRRRLPAIRSVRWTFDRTLAKQLLRRGILIGIGLAACDFVRTYDNHLVFVNFGAERLSEYSRAYQVASWTNVIITLVVARIGYVTFARLKHDAPRFQRAVQLCLWAMLLIGAPLMLSLIFASPYVIRGLYGEKWIESVRYLRFLAPINFAWMVISIGFWVAHARDESIVAVVLPGAMAAAMVLIATPLTNAIGMPGLLIGVGVAVIGGAGASLVYIGRKAGLSLWRELWASALAALLTAGVLYACTLTPLLAPINISAAVGAGYARTLSLTQALGLAIVAFVSFALVILIAQRRETALRIAFLRSAWRGGL